MNICTLAIGNKSQKGALNLAKSLPVPIEIHKSLPKNAILFYKNQKEQDVFNTNCKRFIIRSSYDPEGTLCIDSDVTCVDKKDFLACCEELRVAESGIYSPYIFSAYGYKVPKILDNFIDKKKLMYNINFFKDITRFSEKDLLNLYMPYEWFYFFKFKDEIQKEIFFNYWDYLEKFAIKNKNINLRNESYLVAFSAFYCGLKINKIENKTGALHKLTRIYI